MNSTLTENMYRLSDLEEKIERLTNKIAEIRLGGYSDENLTFLTELLRLRGHMYVEAEKLYQEIKNPNPVQLWLSD